MKVGILDLQNYPGMGVWSWVENHVWHKQLISLTCQVVSVWCRQMGHQVSYAGHYGSGDPRSHLPSELDVVFISAHTFLAPLAYALARIFRLEGTRTVIGGPHAKAYPEDCLRFFDLAVVECDRALIADILAGRFRPGNVVSSAKPYTDVPSIEERLPELRRSAFARGHPHPGSLIPMIASLGCPYTCNFCVDWNTPYHPLPLDRLDADLRFAAGSLPNVKLAFHDPNFGVRFDETVSVFERQPPERRNPYGIECTLASLRPERVVRLLATNCFAVVPSIESWTSAFGNKLGVGNLSAQAKVDKMAERFGALSEQFDYVGTNLILGLDHDEGDEPFQLTRQFIRRTPRVWCKVNMPVPFAGTPMHAQLLREGRVLRRLPFMFYGGRGPYLAMQLKRYDPLDYCEKFTELLAFSVSGQVLRARLAKLRGPLSAVYLFRTAAARSRLRSYRSFVESLRDDPQHLAFQRGEKEDLPDYYVRSYHRVMGRYAEQVPLREMTTPILA